MLSWPKAGGIGVLVFAALCLPGVVEAKQQGDVLVRLRAIGVIPDEDGTTTIGGDISVDTQYVPELDFSYFFTDHIALELILATNRHSVRVNRTDLGRSVKLGRVSLIPPILLLQYHFWPSGKLSPYVGAGLNYTIFYDVNDGNDPAVRNVDYDN